MSPLDVRGGPLTEHDYAFLQGDDSFWPCWGAAMSVVMEFCQESGYGSYGKPTERGKKAMEAYERTELGIG